mgnify:CR=1 FL=1
MKGIRYSVNSPQGKEDLKILSAAVVLMKQLPKTDPHSWDYQAAIHGVLDDPSNSELLKQPFVNNCPHYDQAGKQTAWHFLSWHRYYLYHFEEAVRAVTGRDDFNVPYWNTLDPTQRTLPKEFRDQASGGLPGLSDGTRRKGLNDGSLKITETPDENGKITDNGTKYDQAYENLRSLRNNFLAFSNSIDRTPHASTHGLIGGNMRQVETAGQDPIFWVHHANIDRLWTEICNDRVTAAETLLLKRGMNYGFYSRDKQPITYTYSQAAKGLYQFNYTYDSAIPSSTQQSLKDPPTFAPIKPFYSQSTKAPINKLKDGDIILSKRLNLIPKAGNKILLTIKATACHELGGSIDIFFGDTIVNGKDVIPSQHQNLPSMAALQGGKFLERFYLGSIELFPSATAKSASQDHQHNQSPAAQGKTGQAARQCDQEMEHEFVFDISSKVTKAKNQAFIRDVIHFNIAPDQSSAKDLGSMIIDSISLSQIPV